MARRINKEAGAKAPMEDGASILTEREVEVLIFVTSGLTNAEISNKLFLSRHTVESHLHNIFKKIHAPNRFQAILWAIKNLSRHV